jgi:hypothetical protein
MKKKVIILLVFFAVVAVAAYFLLFKKKKSTTTISGDISTDTANEAVINSIASKYEGKYVYVPGLWQEMNCTDLKSNIDAHDKAGCGTWYIRNGERVTWFSTGISDDKTVSGNVFEVRIEITKEELLAIPYAKR